MNNKLNGFNNGRDASDGVGGSPAYYEDIPKYPQKLTVQSFENELKRYEQTVIDLLGQKYNISPKEFIITVINAIKKSPKLLEVESKSLFAAILLAAECGLKPNAPDGNCYISATAGNNQAQFIIGYRGFIEMAYRSPRVLSIYGEPVFEKDFFEYELGLAPKLIHKPFKDGDRGKLLCVYAVCNMKDAEPLFSVVMKSELDKIQNLSPNSKSLMGAYNNGTDVHQLMHVKAAVKRLLKFIPKNSVPELAKALEIDNAQEGGATVSMNNEGETTILDIPNNKTVKKEKAKNNLFGSDTEDAEVLGETKTT